MKTIHYEDPATKTMFHEFIDTSFIKLSELRSEYEKKDYKTWLNNYNTLSGEFILTVMEVRP